MQRTKFSFHVSLFHRSFIAWLLCGRRGFRSSFVITQHLSRSFIHAHYWLLNLSHWKRDALTNSSANVVCPSQVCDVLRCRRTCKHFTAGKSWFTANCSSLLNQCAKFGCISPLPYDPLAFRRSICRLNDDAIGNADAFIIRFARRFASGV